MPQSFAALGLNSKSFSVYWVCSAYVRYAHGYLIACADSYALAHASHKIFLSHFQLVTSPTKNIS